MSTQHKNIPAIAEEIHKASARAVSIGIAHGGQGYSLSIGQVTKILTRHPTDESEDMAVLHLLQENEELKKDKARLDWLNKDGRVAKFSDGWNAWPYQKTGLPHISRNDIREAIDMAATPNADI